MQFSANLGFLWSELTLPDAIRAAKAAGFDAVECHWPYDFDSAEVKAALAETDLPMLGLNTARGDVSAGDNGLSALPERIPEARAAIDQALAYATEIGAHNIHVMAGFAQGDKAHRVFVENLDYACDRAAPAGISILIEPLNRYDAPGYFLQTTAQATAIMAEVGAANLKLMFDCYHVQLMEGDLTHKLAQLQDRIGHIQFASVPDRGAPDHGEINFDHVFRVVKELGFLMPLGAEYKPEGATGDTLAWLQKAQQI
ncbi:hydroxypyruvate isomerase family protein [Sulfitobacter sp. PS-8MA]|uniref:hydroxypyruvate isomerase family protein n=1 Tax=Sulfitobacter sp. PS-8MA TaxID=3237707 RepID=UPI0034C621DC